MFIETFCNTTAVTIIDISDNTVAHGMSSQSDQDIDVDSPSTSVLSKLKANLRSLIANELEEFEVLSLANTYAIDFSGVSCFLKQKYVLQKVTIEQILREENEDR